MVEARVDRLELALERLADAQTRADQRMDRVEAALERLAAAQERTEAALERLVATVERHSDQIGRLQGWQLEDRYRGRAAAYFSSILRRLHRLEDEEVATLVENAQDQGIITEVERRDALRIDVVVRGRRRNDDQPAYLAVEVSAVVDEHDVQRAQRRAEVLARASGVATMPVVAGEEITPEANEHAASRGVWRVLDGRVEALSAS
jgi:hypothetical protein